MIDYLQSLLDGGDDVKVEDIARLAQRYPRLWKSIYQIHRARFTRGPQQRYDVGNQRAAFFHVSVGDRSQDWRAVSILRVYEHRPGQP